MSRTTTRITKKIFTTMALICFSSGALAEMEVGHVSEVKLNPDHTGVGTLEWAKVIDTPAASAGIARFTKANGILKDWPYWYDEVVYVISGKGKVTRSDPPYTSPKSYIVEPGDFFMVPRSAMVTFEALSDEPFDIFYVIPEN